MCESLNDDLAKIESWCRIWGMTLNPRKSTSIIVSRSRTLDPPHPNLVIGGHTLINSNTLKLLGVYFDSKLTFECHLRSVASNISQKIGILKKCRSLYD